MKIQLCVAIVLGAAPVWAQVSASAVSQDFADAGEAAASAAQAASFVQVVGGERDRVVVSVPLSTREPERRESGLADIVRAKFPLSIEFRDLGVGWRELEYGGESYFTRGEATWVNEAEHLVAYKYSAALNEGAARTERELIGRTVGSGRSFEAGDRFGLTLLPLRNLSYIVTNGQTGLRSFSATRFRMPFDPPLELAAFRQNLSVLYLRKVGEAVSAYASKYLNVTPPLETAFAARQALLPFVESERIFFVPNTTVPWKTNPNLSGRKREHLRRKRGAAMFYQANPAEDGLRAVLFFDNTVRRVDAKAWARISKASGLE